MARSNRPNGKGNVKVSFSRPASQAAPAKQNQKPKRPVVFKVTSDDLKNSDIDKAIEKIVKKFKEMINDQTTDITINLDLKDSFSAQQLQLQKELFKAVIEQVQKNNPSLESLSFYGWEIIPPLIEPEIGNRFRLEIITHYNDMMSALGDVIEQNKHIKNLSLDNKQLHRQAYNSFFVKITKNNDAVQNMDIKNDKEIPPRLSLSIVWDEKASRVDEVEKMAKDRNIKLVRSAPVTIQANTQKLTFQAPAPADEKKKPYKLFHPKGEKKREKMRQEQELKKARDSRIEAYINKSKPSAGDYARHILLDSLFFGTLGTGGGVAIAFTSSAIQAFLLPGVLFTLFGFGISTMGIGFAVAGLVLVGMLVAGIILGKQSTDADHREMKRQEIAAIIDKEEAAAKDLNNNAEMHVELEVDFNNPPPRLDVPADEQDAASSAPQKRPSIDLDNYLAKLDPPRDPDAPVGHLNLF